MIEGYIMQKVSCWQQLTMTDYSSSATNSSVMESFRFVDVLYTMQTGIYTNVQKPGGAGFMSNRIEYSIGY